MFRLLHLGALVAACAFALGLIACGDDSDSSDSAVGVDIDSCQSVEYGGDGDADAVIVTDLPMQGDSSERSAQQVEAVRLALENADWTAGEIALGLQVCDDSDPETGLWAEEICRDNAEAYAESDTVLGVVGTYNSGCAAVAIPILNEAGVAMVSPGNTAICLTQPSEQCDEYDPESLYAAGERNYLRVVPNDAFQGAGLAEFADRNGVERPFVLHAADDPTSSGQAAAFEGAAGQLGLELAGSEAWDPEAEDYRRLMRQVVRSGADGVVLAGLIEQNGAALIDAKVEHVGSNQEVPLLAFDGFNQQATIDETGAASRGMYASVPGRLPERLAGPGERFVAELTERLGGRSLEVFAPYAGEAASVLIDAIAAGGDDRAAVIESAFATPRDGILGEYRFEASGDPNVGSVSIFEANGSFEFVAELTPSRRLVAAARG